MTTLNDIKKFEKHHAALLIFLLIAGVFFINIFAFTAAYSKVSQARVNGIGPFIVVRDAEPDEAAEEQEQADPTFLSGLELQLRELISNQDASMAVYVQDLETGEAIGINDRTTYVSASLYKVFVSYEVARQIDLGLIDPNSATGYDAGSLSIQECLARTLSYSDNNCGRALRKLIEADDAPLTAINDAGFIGTSLINDYPTTSAADVGLFFERVYEATEFGIATNDLLLNPLLEQEIDNRLPVPLPDETKIAHKTADLDGYSHDGGIIYSPGGDYILVVLSGPWANGYTDAPSAHIAVSSLVYDWFNPTVDSTTF